VLEKLAIRAGKSAAASSRYLCAPIEAEGLHESLFEARPLLGWAYFNPYGPTECQLTLELVPRRDAYLLVFWTIHPISPESTVLGVLPSKIALDKSWLLVILNTLFDHRSDGRAPHLEYLPSYPIFFQGRTPLTPQEIADLVLKRLGHTDIENDLRTEVESLLRFPYQPWERFRAEWEPSGLADSLPEEVARDIRTGMNRRIDIFLAEDKAKARKRQPVHPPRVKKGAMNLIDWWEIVSDPRHIEVYRAAMPQAWRFSQAITNPE
jgi:hypothetical protein